MAKKYKQPKKDTWVRDTAGTNKKVDSYIKSQGGDEWDIAGFKQYMDYHTARQDQMNQANNKAVDTWNKSFSENVKKQHEKEQQDTLKEQIKKSEEQRKKRESEQQKKSLIPQVNKKSLFGDLKDIGKLAYDTLNPFDNVTTEDAYNNYQHTKSSKAFKEIQRGSNRAVDSASFTAMSNLDKKMTGETPDYLSKRKVGEGGATDFITSGLGYLVPGVAEYKALNSLKAGKALTQFGAKGIGQRLTSEGAKGAIVGAGLSIPEVGVKELLNPKDQNWKDNAKYIGTNTALGAIADPLLYGVGKGISKGLESASNRTMGNLLPNNQSVSSELANTYKSVNSFNSKPNYAPSLLPRTKVGTQPSQEFLSTPRVDMPTPDISAPRVDTSPIDNEIQALTQHLEQVKNQPKPKTKTEIEDALRSLEINDSYLNSSRQKGQISSEEYFRKIQENELKREVLVKENKIYTHDVPDDLKTIWNNDTKSYELGDFSMKKAYGGGFNVQKGGQSVGKFRTQEEATKFMQESVGKEQGNNVSFDRDGVLNWKSTYDEANKKWDIQAGDYSIHRGGKDNWTVKNNDQVIGTYKNEKKAREVAQRHFDSQPKPNEQTTALEQQLKSLKQQREGLLNSTLSEEVSPQQTGSESIHQVENPVNTNTLQQSVNPLESLPKQPENIPNKPNERSHYGTIGNSEKISPELLQRLTETDKTYTPMSNQELVDFANEYVGRDIEQAYQFVKNTGKRDPRHIAVGHRLIDELQKNGQFDRALDVIDILAEHGTKSGQNVQAFSLYNRLTPEGQLLRAQRRVNKINESITNPDKKVKLTEQNIQDITHAADSIRNFTGQEEMTNNVIKIMDSIKNGNTATDTELETVRSFVNDAKKFIGDVSPKGVRKAPKPVKDVRTRDKVVEHMNSAEEAARQRLKQRMNRANSLPVDVFYDLTIIGASKVAKGTVKLADFTEEMVKEFGEHIRPYMSQIYDKAVDNFNIQSESITAKRLSEVEKITNKALKDKNLGEDEADIIREFARRVSTMTGDARLESSMELQSILQNLERPTFGQKISSAQTIAQLLNPKTIVRNGIGNELFYRVEQINKFLATPVDIVRSKLFGKERTVTFITHNQGQYWKNFLSGGKAGWKGQNPMGLTTAYDLQPQVFRSKFNPLTYLQKTLGATLRSFDNAGYMRAYNKTLGELASLRAINEGLKGDAKKQAIQTYIREADENMKNIADQYGKYATFQDNTTLSNLLTKVKKGMNHASTKALTLGLAPTKDFGFGDLILKYPKTPGNLIMRALEYSPAGLIRSGSLIKEAVKSKNPLASREATLAFTRAITGTAGFSILGYALADIGILTSKGDSDYEVASLERNAGKQPNSVNVTALKRLVSNGFDLKKAKPQEGDTYVSYDWAQPISMAIALGTGANQSIKEKGNPSLMDAGLSAFNSASDTVINMSVLSGLNSFLSGYQGKGMSDKLAGVAKGIAGSFIPTAVNQVRQLNDNTARTTYDPTFTGETLNRAKNRLSSTEKFLPPSYDTLGNKRETYQNGSNNAFNVLLNPSFVSKYQPNPEAKYVLDFINKTGVKSVAPHLVDKKLDGKKLTPEQYTKFQKIMGLETQKGFKDVIPELQDETGNEKIRKVLEKVLRDAGKTARSEIRKEMK